MPSETQTLALHLIRVLYDTSDGSAQQWRVLAEIAA
jgi:hypothetical protein